MIGADKRPVSLRALPKQTCSRQACDFTRDARVWHVDAVGQLPDGELCSGMGEQFTKDPELRLRTEDREHHGRACVFVHRLDYTVQMMNRRVGVWIRPTLPSPHSQLIEYRIHVCPRRGDDHG